jgi:hypothetical protein
LTGTVKAISPRAADSDGPERKVFRVIVAMEQPTSLLRPEMTGNAKLPSVAAAPMRVSLSSPIGR